MRRDTTLLLLVLTPNTRVTNYSITAESAVADVAETAAAVVAAAGVADVVAAAVAAVVDLSS